MIALAVSETVDMIEAVPVALLLNSEEGVAFLPAEFEEI